MGVVRRPVGRQDELVAGLAIDRVAGDRPQSNLGAAQVLQDGEHPAAGLGDLADRAERGGVLVVVPVREVEPEDVDARLDHRAQRSSARATPGRRSPRSWSGPCPAAPPVGMTFSIGPRLPGIGSVILASAGRAATAILADSATKGPIRPGPPVGVSCRGTSESRWHRAAQGEPKGRPEPSRTCRESRPERRVQGKSETGMFPGVTGEAGYVSQRATTSPHLGVIFNFLLVFLSMMVHDASLLGNVHPSSGGEAIP